MHNLEKYSLVSLDPLDLAPVAPSMACVVAELPNPVAEGRGCCGTRRGALSSRPSAPGTGDRPL